MKDLSGNIYCVVELQGGTIDGYFPRVPKKGELIHSASGRAWRVKEIGWKKGDGNVWFPYIKAKA